MTSSNTTFTALFAAALALGVGALPSTVDAQDAHDHAAEKKSAAGEHGEGAQHGGQFVEVGEHVGVEMVASATSLVFHMSEDHKPMDLNGAAFKAIVQADGATKILPLTPEGDTLVAKLDAPLPKGAIIAISGKDGHGHTVQARLVKE